MHSDPESPECSWMTVALAIINLSEVAAIFGIRLRLPDVTWYSRSRRFGIVIESLSQTDEREREQK